MNFFMLRKKTTLNRCQFINYSLYLDRSRPNAEARTSAFGLRSPRKLRRRVDGTHSSIDDLSRAEKITATYVSRVLRLAYLSPTTVESILDGKYPAHLTL